jgi:hypothetical protein
MALPVSQYSVLDARRIERLGDNRFRCFVDGVRLFSFSVEPVVDSDAFKLLRSDPLDDVPPALKAKRLSAALSLMEARMPTLQAHATTRASALLRDHLSVK